MKNKKLYVVAALWVGSIATAILIHKKGVEKVRMEELSRRISVMETDKRKMSQMYKDGFDSGIACSIKALREQGQSEEFIKGTLIKIGLDIKEAEEYLKQVV